MRLNKHESGYEAPIEKMPSRVGNGIHAYQSIIKE